MASCVCTGERALANIQGRVGSTVYTLGDTPVFPLGAECVQVANAGMFLCA